MLTSKAVRRHFLVDFYRSVLIHSVCVCVYVRVCVCMCVYVCVCVYVCNMMHEYGIMTEPSIEPSISLCISDV